MSAEGQQKRHRMARRLVSWGFGSTLLLVSITVFAGWVVESQLSKQVSGQANLVSTFNQQRVLGKQLMNDAALYVRAVDGGLKEGSYYGSAPEQLQRLDDTLNQFRVMHRRIQEAQREELADQGLLDQDPNSNDRLGRYVDMNRTAAQLVVKLQGLIESDSAMLRSNKLLRAQEADAAFEPLIDAAVRDRQTELDDTLKTLFELHNRLSLGVLAELILLGAVLILPLSHRVQTLINEVQREHRSALAANRRLERVNAEYETKAQELVDTLDHAQTQSALFEYASNRFQQLFGGLPVGCFTYDANGTIQEWNQAMSELVGIEGHRVCLQDVRHVLDSEMVDRSWTNILSEVLENRRKLSLEYAFIDPGGVERNLLIVTYPLESSEGDILGGIASAIDMTERVQFERALRESEERYDLAVQGSASGIWDWDFRTNRMHWSPTALEILGIMPEDNLGVPTEMWERIDEEHRKDQRRALDAHLADREPFSLEVPIILGSGDKRWVLITGQATWDSDGKALRMAGSIADVTERMEAKIALEESEQRFRDVSEAAGECVFEVDAAGHFVFVTRRIKDILGYEPIEVIGMSVEQFLAPDERRTVFSGQVQMHRAFKNCDQRFACKDGELRWLRWSAVPIFDSDGHFCGYRGTAMDITGEKEAERRISEAHERLNQTLESIGDYFVSLDPENRISYFNSSAAELMGTTEPIEIGNTLGMHVPNEMLEIAQQVIQAVRDTGESATFEACNEPSQRWYEFRVYPAKEQISLYWRDVTERKAAETRIASQLTEINEKNEILRRQQKELQLANDRLATLARIDGLTGMMNHKSFQAILSQQHAAAEATGAHLSLIMLDVDDFKGFNDTFGHPAGDVVLKKVAAIIRDSVRKSDYVARYGGEEFVVVLPGASGEDASRVAETIRANIERHKWTKRAITASLGVSVLGESAADKQDLIDTADQALYAAKRAGRNQVVRYASQMKRAA